MIAAAYGRNVMLLLLALSLSACTQRYYYNKPHADYAAFSVDHAACLREVGIPSATQTNVLIEPEPYRRCLGARGWTRAKQAEPAPTDWYRGVEDREVMSIDAPPPPRPNDGVSYDTLRAHCRALHLTSPNWRHNLPAYEACLRR